MSYNSTAYNVAREPGGAEFLIGLPLAGVWYFTSYWASIYNSSGFLDVFFHFSLMGVAVFCAVLVAGASLHEIDKLGHTSRLLTIYMVWVGVVWWAKLSPPEGPWASIGLLALILLFEIPLNILEKIARSNKAVGRGIKFFYQGGTIIVMCEMIAATTTSFYVGFVQHGDYRYIVNNAYKIISKLIMVVW